MSYEHINFLGSPRKSYVPHTTFLDTTYDLLGISTVISGAIFVENNFFSKSETAYFSSLFHTKIVLKKLSTFTKLKKQYMSYVHVNFHGSPRKLYVPHRSFLFFSALL